MKKKFLICTLVLVSAFTFLTGCKDKKGLDIEVHYDENAGDSSQYQNNSQNDINLELETSTQN